LRNDRRFLTFLTDEEAKKERMPQRLFREMFINEDEVDDDDEELESARARRCEWDAVGMGSATGAETAAAAAAASCSLECRRSARRRRVLSGLRRRGSRIMLDRSKTAEQILHGAFIDIRVYFRGFTRYSIGSQSDRDALPSASRWPCG
jgi:hypothetical protein